MKQKKFIREVRHADAKQLEKLFIKLLSKKYDYGTGVQLDTLAVLIGNDRAESLTLRWYDRRARRSDRRRYRTLTGYGQCQGLLLARDNDIVTSCCEKMARVVAYGHVHYFDGRIFVPGVPSSPCEQNGALYLLSKNHGLTLDKCPFCGTPITECLSVKKEKKNAEKEHQPAENKNEERP